MLYQTALIRSKGLNRSSRQLCYEIEMTNWCDDFRIEHGYTKSIQECITIHIYFIFFYYFMTTITTKLKLNEYNATNLIMMSDLKQRANPISEQNSLTLHIKTNLSRSDFQFGIIGI